MFKKALIYILGFGLGAFMLLNGIAILYRILAGDEWIITPAERVFSFIITFLVGLVLVIWTYLLVKKR